MNGENAFLYAIFLMVKKYGKDNAIKFPLTEEEPVPKDGIWTFGTMVEPNTGVLVIQLVEGKENVEKLIAAADAAEETETDEVSTGPEGSEKDELDLLREEWLGENTPSLHST